MSALRLLATVVLLAAYATPVARAQSSSLYLAAPPQEPAAAPQVLQRDEGGASVMSAAVAGASFVAVGRPPPRQFAVHDLITIVVRESVTSDAESDLKTEKTFKKEGKISEMPRLTLSDLLQLQVNQSDLSGREPEVKLQFADEWEGSGTQKQRNSFTARITARIIDIRPNATLVLEARKKIQSDTEAFTMIVTGTCRREDITADNTVLSTQLYDLNVLKEHTGELRTASRKGLLTKVFELIFNF